MVSKKIKIENKDIEVREFLTEQVLELWVDSKTGIDIITDAIVGKPQGEKKLLTLCTDLTDEEIGKLGFGDFKRLVEAMREVNTDFFVIYELKMKQLVEIMSRRGPSATPEPLTGSPGKGTETV